MDWLKIHLALNHISVIGFPFLLLLLVAGAIKRNEPIQRLAILWLAIFAAISIALKFTGDFAAEQAGPKLDFARAYVNAHEQSADQATTAIFLTGLVAAITAFRSRRARLIPKWSILSILILTIVTCALLARTAHVGGQISHPELRAQIDFHLGRLEYLRTGPFLKPTTTRAWLSPRGARYLQWTTRQWLANQPDTYDHWINALETEQHALITLGHYQRRWLNLPTTNALAKLALAPREILPRFTLHYHEGRPTAIRVTARPDQIYQLTTALASVPRE